MNDTDQNSAMDERSNERVQRILRQTQREAGARDILTFTFGRAWSVLLILGATFVVVADQMAKNGDSGATSTGSQNGTSV